MKACLCILVVSLAANGANAAPLLDQDNLYDTCCTIDVVHPNLFQQSVTAGVEVTLAGVLVEEHERFGTGAVVFSLYEGLATPD